VCAVRVWQVSISLFMFLVCEKVYFVCESREFLASFSYIHYCAHTLDNGLLCARTAGCTVPYYRDLKAEIAILDDRQLDNPI